MKGAGIGVACVAAIVLCGVVILGATSVAGQGEALADAAGVAATRANVAHQQDREKRLARHYAALMVRADALGGRMTRLLTVLWPLRLDAFVAEISGIEWAEADRRYRWTRALFRAARASGQAYADHDVKVRAGRIAHEEAASRLRQERVKAGEAFSEALSHRLAVLEGKTTTQPLDPADALGEALGGIEAEADQETQPATSSAVSRCRLSRPVAGGDIAPHGQTGGAGVMLAVPEGTPVVAAASGQVDFSGVLRGLGHVVILSHDGQLHTVYACLASSEVFVGDRVVRDGRLGAAGNCGLARHPGVYFELRFREKALNPAEWFAARP